MFSFFAFASSITTNLCLKSRKGEATENCIFDNVTSIFEDEIRNFQNFDNIVVQICSSNTLISAADIANHSNITFFAKEKKILNISLKKTNSFLGNIRFENIEIYFDRDSINTTGLFSAKNVSILTKMFKVSANEYTTDLESLQGIVVINASKSINISLNFGSYVQASTALTINTPTINLKEMNTNAIVSFAGQAFCIRQESDETKYFEFMPLNRKTSCVFCDFAAKNLTFSIMNMFTSTLFNAFLLSFEVDIPVNFRFLKCSWDGFSSSPITIHQNSRSTIVAETNKVPLLLLCNNSITDFILKTNYFESKAKLVLDNAKINIRQTRQGRASFHYMIFTASGPSTVKLSDNITGVFDYIMCQAGSGRVNISGVAEVLMLDIISGSAIFDQLTMLRPRLSMVFSHSYLYIDKLISTDTKTADFTIEYISNLLLNNKPEFRQKTIDIREKVNIIRFITKFSYPQVKYNNDVYSVYGIYTTSNDSLVFFVFSRIEETSKYTAIKYCIAEKEEYLEYCPSDTMQIANCSVYDKLISKLPVTTKKLTFYVAGDIGETLNTVTRINRDIEFIGLTSDAQIELSDTDFYDVTFNNINVIYSSFHELRVDYFRVCNATFSGIDDHNIMQATIEYTPDFEFPFTNVGILILEFNSRDLLTIYANDTHIIINETKVIKPPLTLMFKARAKVNLIITGDAAKDISWYFKYNSKMHIYSEWKLSKFVVPPSSICYFSDNCVVPSNLLLNGQLIFINKSEASVEKIELDAHSQIVSLSQVELKVGTYVLNDYWQTLRRMVKITADNVLFKNSSNVVLNNVYGVKNYTLEILTSATINIPEDDPISEITITIQYQMGCVPFVSINGGKNLTKINVIMFNTGSSEQLISDYGWSGVEVGVIEVNDTINATIETSYVSESWAFQNETRAFDLIASKTRDYKKDSIYSIVRKNNTIINDGDAKEKTSSKKLVYTIIGIISGIIIVCAVIFVIRYVIKRNQIKNFSAEAPTQDSMFESLIA